MFSKENLYSRRLDAGGMKTTQFFLSLVYPAAVPWFRGRVCLFLVDDLWPTKNCRTGFLSDLRQLLREVLRAAWQ